MGYKTIKYDEFDDRVQQYWLPSDYDGASATQTLGSLASRFEGFVRLTFDDSTQVLTAVEYRFPNGSYQSVWATAEDPAGVVNAAQRAANRPASWDEMWQTYKGWNEFCQYAESVAAGEATDFLNAVAAYRQAPSLPAQLDIYGRFIVAGSPEQVTLDNAELIERIEGRTDGGADVFDEAETEVVGMLRGRFSGFLAWYDRQV